MRKQGAGKFPALILYNEMMTVPRKEFIFTDRKSDSKEYLS